MMTEFLALGDAHFADQSARSWFEHDWHVQPRELDRFDILIVGLSEWAHEVSAWALLRERATGELFEVTGSHCSCFGFEDQFSPARSSVKYLLSNQFAILPSLDESRDKVRDYARRNLAGKP